jgi:hypothetical protein
MRRVIQSRQSNANLLCQGKAEQGANIRTHSTASWLAWIQVHSLGVKDAKHVCNPWHSSHTPGSRT